MPAGRLGVEPEGGAEGGPERDLDDAGGVPPAGHGHQRGARRVRRPDAAEPLGPEAGDEGGVGQGLDVLDQRRPPADTLVADRPDADEGGDARVAPVDGGDGRRLLARRGTGRGRPPPRTCRRRCPAGPARPAPPRCRRRRRRSRGRPPGRPRWPGPRWPRRRAPGGGRGGAGTGPCRWPAHPRRRWRRRPASTVRAGDGPPLGARPGTRRRRGRAARSGRRRRAATPALTSGSAPQRCEVGVEAHDVDPGASSSRVGPVGALTGHHPAEPVTVPDRAPLCWSIWRLATRVTGPGCVHRAWSPSRRSGRRRPGVRPEGDGARGERHPAAARLLSGEDDGERRGRGVLEVHGQGDLDVALGVGWHSGSGSR